MRGDAVLTPSTVEGYEPETVDSYELGLKAACSTAAPASNFAVFRADYTDQQITRQEPAPRRHREFRRQRGRIDDPGRGARGPIAVTDKLSITYGVGYTDAEFDKYESYTVVTNPSPPPATIAVPVGSRGLRRVPEHAGMERQPHGELQPQPRARARLAARSVTGRIADSYHMFDFREPVARPRPRTTRCSSDAAWTPQARQCACS